MRETKYVLYTREQIIEHEIRKKKRTLLKLEKKRVGMVECHCGRMFFPRVADSNGHSGFHSVRCMRGESVRIADKTLSPQERKLAKEQRRQDRLKKAKSSKEFFDSPEWQNLRYQALVIHGRKCLLCGASPPNVILQVDHIKPRSTHPELALSISNLQVLCSDCNRGKSNRYLHDFRSTL